MQRIRFVISQTKRNIKNWMWWYHLHIVHKLRTSHMLISFKILFLNIYLTCVWLSLLLSTFIYRRSGFFKLDICLSPGIEAICFSLGSNHIMKYSLIFNLIIQVNPNTDIENICQFSFSYTFDLTANTCNKKNLNHYLMM